MSEQELTTKIHLLLGNPQASRIERIEQLLDQREDYESLGLKNAVAKVNDRIYRELYHLHRDLGDFIRWYERRCAERGVNPEPELSPLLLRREYFGVLMDREIGIRRKPFEPF